MVQKLNRINVKNLTDNVFKLLDNDWMLVTAGTQDSFNTMTASWGSFGILWNKPIAICFIRPQRYTIEFMNRVDFFTLSFFAENYRDSLNYHGSHSGRKVDKMAHTGLTSVSTENGSVYFSEARIVLECKKLYADSLNPDNFLKKSLINEIYPNSDFHHFFIGEIINCFSSEISIKNTQVKFDENEGDNQP